MSHSKIRSEKICLNCGTETPGRYCPACGQENIEPKQTVWHLITHFFSDITHFDGKFFLTVKDLFVKPGFLSKEYMMGRRASYLDPIRMYIFTSAIFFLIFFSVFNVKNLHFSEDARNQIKKDSTLSELLSRVKSRNDSFNIMKAYYAAPVTKLKHIGDSINQNRGLKSDSEHIEYSSKAAYDSAQNALPVAERDGWLKRKMRTKNIELYQRYQLEQGNLIRELISNYLHNCPKILFISLPVFALLLKVLYVRRRQFFYVDHGIFSVHLFIYSFLILLLMFGLNKAIDGTGWGWLQWLYIPLSVYPFVYYFKAMRRFYGQSRGRTFLKYLLLFILSFFVQLFIFTSAILFTVFEA